MKQFIRGIGRMGGSLLGIGIALLIVGLLMGGRPAARVRWQKGLVLEKAAANQTQLSSAGHTDTAAVPYIGTVQNLAFSLAGAEVVLQTGDAYAFSTDKPDDVQCEVSGGTWHIVSSKDIPSPAKITITVPKNTALQNLKLELGAGTLVSDGLHCETASIEVGAGTLDLTNFSCTNGATLSTGMGTMKLQGELGGKTSVECGMGTVKLQLKQPADYGYSVDYGLGSIRIGDAHYAGIGSTKTDNSSADTFFALECGMGSIDVNFSA